MTSDDQYQSGWRAGYASARAFYGDAAPIALGKLRALLGPVAEAMPDSAAGSPVGAALAAAMEIIEATR